MISIDNKDARNYCSAADNKLAAKVDWVYDQEAGTLAVTDATTYEAGDGRANVNLEVFDYFGGKVDANIAAAAVGGATTIDVSDLNPERGFAATVLVVSTKGKRKDGSRFHIALNPTAGSFVIIG